MSDANCTPGREPRTVAASFFFILFLNQISLELLNGFVPNLQEIRVWSLARTSLNVKVKDQRHQGQNEENC